MDKPAEATEPEDHLDGVSDTHVLNSWEFAGESPDPEKIKEMLEGLPDWYGGLKPVDFLEFVQPLGQGKNLAPKNAAKEFVEVWTLYITVAGRVTAINRAAAKNHWRVDFVPEPVTPTGMPGYLEFGERIVYREYCELYQLNSDGTETFLGRKGGTAWVPGSGGINAVASNRFEKVETSARGRAIGAWGIGVLPGSGLASSEEMFTARELLKFTQTQQRMGRDRRAPRSREEMEETLRISLGELQEVTGASDDVMFEKIRAHCSRAFAKEVSLADNGSMVFASLKPGELMLVLNWVNSIVAKTRSEQNMR